MTDDPASIDERVSRGWEQISRPLMQALQELRQSIPDPGDWTSDRSGRCMAGANIAIRTAWEAAVRAKITGKTSPGTGEAILLLRALKDAAPIFAKLRTIEDAIVQADIQDNFDTFNERWRGKEWPDGILDSIHLLRVMEGPMVPPGERHGLVLTALRSAIKCAHDVIMPYPVPELEELAAQRRREGT